MERLSEIIIELKVRNYNSFDEFYNLTKKNVYFTIINIIKRKDIAEELMQDSYLRFLENIDKCDEKNKPVAYLVMIARNLAINEYNRRKREVKMDETDLDFIPGKNTQNGLDLGIINNLEGLEKEIVTMHIIGDLKFREIASIISKPLGTVLWLYNKAIKKLKRKVGEENEKK